MTTDSDYLAGLFTVSYHKRKKILQLRWLYHYIHFCDLSVNNKFWVCVAEMCRGSPDLCDSLNLRVTQIHT